MDTTEAVATAVPTQTEAGDEVPRQNGNAPKEVGQTGADTVSRFRSALPQVLAATAKNLLLLDLGMTLAFPTIVIPALLDGQDERGLTFTKEQASWFGSVLYICQPLGSVLSGIVLEPLGRKTSMMVVNIPHIVGWLLLLTANSVVTLYFAIVLLGLGVGFMEAPIITYIGEIAEAKLRGTLTSYSNLFATFGIAFIYLVGTLADWRTTAGISVTVPIVTIIAISQVPETPLWLLSRGRKEEAEKALCWLRGWVEPRAVEAELAELMRYSEATRLNKEAPACYVNTVCLDSEKQGGVDPDAENSTSRGLTLREKAADFLRPQMLRPLGLIVGFFFFANFTGMTATRPYMVKLIKDFGFPIEPYRANVVFGAVGFLGSVLCMATTATLGRRPMALGSLLVCALSALGLASGRALGPWFTFSMFVLLVFASYYGAGGLVWTLVSEVFPFRGRGLASGLSAAMSYVLTFVATKSFLSLESSLGLHGVFFLYAASSALGLVFLYSLLPETEGRTLEDIEVGYAKEK